MTTDPDSKVGQTHLKYKNLLIARISTFYPLARFFVMLIRQVFPKSRANAQDSKVVQKIFENVRAEGNITVGTITQIYQIVSNLSRFSKPTGFPQNIPDSSTDKFIGRARELERLHHQLQRQNEVVIAAVEGMGGVGKTELAIQYSLLHLQSHNYPGGICWLRATEQDIGLQIVQFALTDLGLQPPKDLELLERVRWCWQHWRQGNTLIVFDDVKNYSHIKPYLPPQPSQFKVVITTRLKLDLASSLFLSVLSETDALLLLAQLIGEEKQIQELALAQELCRRLGYLPLALQLVGRYVKKRKITLAEMLRRLEEKGLGHPSLIVKENDSTWTLNVKHGVAAAFELSWSDLSDDAQKLGCLLSLFANAPIPWSLVERAAVEQDQEELEDARVELENLHLLQGEETYQLHQLIHEFLRDKQKNLAATGEQKYNLCQVMVEVAKEIPQSPNQEFIRSVKDAIPHLAEVAQHLTDTIIDQELIWAFIGLGRFYNGQGLYALAEPWYKQCLSVAQCRVAESHPLVAASFNNLAELYRLQGRYVEAEPLYEQALNLYKKILGEEHPDVATCLNNLAELYRLQGRYVEAKPLYEQALNLYKKILGEEYPEVATSLNNLAGLYYLQGQYVKAEPLYEQALNLYRKILEEHLNVTTSLNNLAEVYRLQGRYVKAEPLYQQALKLYRNIVEEQLNVATSLNNLAGLYRLQGRYVKAEPLYQQALYLRRHLLGEEHPDIATSLNNLAGLYYSQGQYVKAKPLYEQALNLYRSLLGEEYPEVATCLNNLAEVYRLQGRYVEAEPLYQQALDLRRHLLGEEHPDVATSLNNLAELYRLQGRYAEAEPLYQQALYLRRHLLGEEHPDIATSLNNLAGFYYSQEQYSEAEHFYKQALDLRRHLLGEEHPDIAASLNNLAGLYRLQKRYAKAESFYKQALQLYEKLLGEKHPNVATCLNNLAGLYRSQEQYAEAESLYRLALQLRRHLLGKEHPDVAISLNNLAGLYDSQGQYTKAEFFYQQALKTAECSLGINHFDTVTIRNNLQSLQNIFN